jgi:hypothetical protein
VGKDRQRENDRAATQHELHQIGHALAIGIGGRQLGGGIWQKDVRCEAFDPGHERIGRGR